MSYYASLWNKNGDTSKRLLLLGSTTSSVASLPSGYSGTLVTNFSNADCDVSGTKQWYSSSYRNSIVEVFIVNKIYPVNADYIFSRMGNLTSIINISNIDTSNSITLRELFRGCSSLTSIDVSNFNTSNVTNMGSMFSGCSLLTSLDVSNFDTSNVTNMASMFSGCSSLTSIDVSNFDTTNVTTMNAMFNGCPLLTSIDVSNFNTTNVTTMASMFSGCSSLTSIDVSNFDTTNVTTTYSMFSGCSSLTSIDVFNFDTTNVTEMSKMFLDCSNLKTIFVDEGKFLVSQVTYDTSIFENCYLLVGQNGTTYNANYIDKTYARIDKPGTPGYFTEGKKPIYFNNNAYKNIYFNGVKVKDIYFNGIKRS